MQVYYLRAQICSEYWNFVNLGEHGCLESHECTCDVNTLSHFTIPKSIKIGVLRIVKTR